MLKHYLPPALLALALLFPIAAIAADDQPGDGRKNYTITMKNHRFDPLELVVSAGQKLKITVKNSDQSPIEFESAQLDREKIVQPGNEITVLLNPLKPGTYGYFDDFHSDSKGLITAK